MSHTRKQKFKILLKDGSGKLFTTIVIKGVKHETKGKNNVYIRDWVYPLYPTVHTRMFIVVFFFLLSFPTQMRKTFVSGDTKDNLSGVLVGP